MATRLRPLLERLQALVAQLEVVAPEAPALGEAADALAEVEAQLQAALPGADPPAERPLLLRLRSRQGRLRHVEPPPPHGSTVLESALALRALRKQLQAGGEPVEGGDDLRERLFLAFAGLPAAMVESMLEQCGGDVPTAFAVLAGISDLPEEPDSLPEQPAQPADQEQELRAAIATFMTAESVDAITSSFGAMRAHAGGDDYEALKARCSPLMSFRQRQLWALLDAKRAATTKRSEREGGVRAVVVGGGPVGLRAAVELALCRVPVTVLERREEFSRANILHLWAWVVSDLTRLGAKVLFPKFCSSGGGGRLHVGTAELQALLLKVALVLGVQARFGAAFERVEGGAALTADGRAFPCEVVLDAGGKRSALCEQYGFEKQRFAIAQAIGLVVHYRNAHTPEERRLEEFAWALQFNQKLFRDLLEREGVGLQNVVYYRGSSTHYYVCTPTRRSLAASGVLRRSEGLGTEELLARENVDQEALDAFARRVAGFCGLPEACAVAQRAALFDFSERLTCREPVKLEDAGRLMVGVVGDALVEPFWPEGLGINRGFLSALDAAWTACDWGARGKSDDDLLRERRLTYGIMKHISAFTRAALQNRVTEFSTDPRTRYARSEFRR